MMPHRPLSSSFLDYLKGVLNINHEKEKLLRAPYDYGNHMSQNPCKAALVRVPKP